MTTKQRAYFDKSAISEANISKYTEFGLQVCYSDALFFDLKNDTTTSFHRELEILNKYKAAHLSEDHSSVILQEIDAAAAFKNVDRFQISFLAPLYSFICGGGNDRTLQDVAHDQAKEITSYSPLSSSIAADFTSAHLTSFSQNHTQLITAGQLRKEMQSASKKWNGKKVTISEAANEDQDLHQNLKEIIPSTAPRKIEDIVRSALMLSALNLTQDKGLTSPNYEKSLKASGNTIVDCLHIAYALHCHVFVSKDKEAIRKHELLCEHWNLPNRCRAEL